MRVSVSLYLLTVSWLAGLAGGGLVMVSQARGAAAEQAEAKKKTRTPAEAPAPASASDSASANGKSSPSPAPAADRWAESAKKSEEKTTPAGTAAKGKSGTGSSSSSNTGKKGRKPSDRSKTVPRAKDGGADQPGEKGTRPPDAPDTSAAEKKEKEARTATLAEDKLEGGFSRQPAEVQGLLRYALELTGRGLTYRTASADPDLGGTDCSGFVYHVLQKHGYGTVPRQSDQMYEWAWRAGTFRACNGLSMNTFEFKELRPGDLLFWVNTTKDGRTDRDPPVTHVMIYLGRRAADQHPVCAGASDGRTYDGQRMCGVSVFDFRLPAPDSGARFIGYAHLPPPQQQR